MKKIFIDGSNGTTGLRIHERLKACDAFSLITLSEADRKNPVARREALNASDLSFLCLPDAAAIEAAAMVKNPDTVIIDTSTAHRTDPDWVYGFPELTGQREKIAAAHRIANPGCHASGFISLIAPLMEAGVLSHDVALSCTSLTGYSGGGKSMIAAYESEGASPLLASPRLYAVGQQHKHLPEMTKLCALTTPPIFLPIVSSFYAGMEVIVPLFASQVKGTPEDLREIYRNYYHGKVVRFAEHADEAGFLAAGALTGYDDMQIAVFGCEERITLISRFDNLGKGASGAAIQSMNLVLGREETTSLVLSETTH